MNDMNLAELPQIEPGIYRHIKGSLYEVIEVARHSETLEALVVYRALYGRRELWIRPYAMFTERIDTPAGPRPRFEKINGVNESP